MVRDCYCGLDTMLGQDRNNTSQSVFPGLHLSEEDSDELINHPKEAKLHSGRFYPNSHMFSLYDM